MQPRRTEKRQHPLLIEQKHRVARGAVAALERFLVGAAGRLVLVERLGDGCRWHAVAVG